VRWGGKRSRRVEQNLGRTGYWQSIKGTQASNEICIAARVCLAGTLQEGINSRGRKGLSTNKRKRKGEGGQFPCTEMSAMHRWGDKL